MKKLLPACALLISCFTLASEEAHWSYSGDTGPDKWGSLKPEFVACGEGKNQSPINLMGMVSAEQPELKENYSTGGKHIVNNGHAVQIDVIEGSFVELEGKKYQLLQAHFHAPSEHQIDGKSFAMEAHLVHADADGNMLVIGMLFEEGETDRELDKVWAQVPKEVGKKGPFTMPVDPSKILPENLDHYRYNGSLTTPPCSEGVRWVVLKQIESVSTEQLEKYQSFFEHPTNRPVQPKNARLVLE